MTGLRDVIAVRGLPWSVVHVGARVELVFAALSTEKRRRHARGAGRRPAACAHLWLINPGVLIAPFHTMMLVLAITEDAAVDRLVAAVDGFAGALEGLSL